jgi:RHS repeat-associated protein
MGSSLGGAVDVVQTTNYYPFGLVMNQSNNNSDPSYQKNKYLYNGKELQDVMLNGVKLSLYYYGARMYDPQIGRFICLDPLASKFPWVTPYNYAENSPISNLDLWGLQAFPFMLGNSSPLILGSSNPLTVVGRGSLAGRVGNSITEYHHLISNAFRNNPLVRFGIKNGFKFDEIGTYVIFLISDSDNPVDFMIISIDMPFFNRFLATSIFPSILPSIFPSSFAVSNEFFKSL